MIGAPPQTAVQTNQMHKVWLTSEFYGVAPFAGWEKKKKEAWLVCMPERRAHENYVFRTNYLEKFKV